MVSRNLGLANPDHVAALHLYDYELGGYAASQSTRPQLMAVGVSVASTGTP